MDLPEGAAVLQVIEKYRPEVIVYQSGADSLTGDRLGKFNLSTAVTGPCLCLCSRTPGVRLHSSAHLAASLVP